MSGSAGFLAIVNVSNNTTVQAGDAMTDSGDGLRFFTAASARRLWDPEVAIVVRANAIVQPASAYELDHLLGQLTFGATPTQPITVDHNYLDLFQIAQANGYSAVRQNGELICTVFQDTAVNRDTGLMDFSATIERLDLGLDDLDPGGAELIIADILDSGITKVFEINSDTTQGKVVRAFVKFFSEELAQAVADLAGATLTVRGVILGESVGSWSYGDPGA